MNSTRLKLYEEEVKRKKIMLYFVYPAFTFFSVFFCVLLVTGKLDNTLEALGLPPFLREKRGVYANCSNDTNRSNKFCNKTNYAVEKEWSEVTRGRGGFSLSE